MKLFFSCLTAGLIALFSSQTLWAAIPKNPTVIAFMQDLSKAAKQEDPSFTAFSAERGKLLYFKEHIDSEDGDKRTCATCHKDNPMLSSKHAVTGKLIDPLSPAVNRKRFTKESKIKKWFRRNCKWTFERSCTALEQGDFFEYIYSL